MDTNNTRNKYDEVNRVKLSRAHINSDKEDQYAWYPAEYINQLNISRLNYVPQVLPDNDVLKEAKNKLWRSISEIIQKDAICFEDGKRMIYDVYSALHLFRNEVAKYTKLTNNFTKEEGRSNSLVAVGLKLEESTKKYEEGMADSNALMIYWHYTDRVLIQKI